MRMYFVALLAGLMMVNTVACTRGTPTTHSSEKTTEKAAQNKKVEQKQVGPKENSKVPVKKNEPAQTADTTPASTPAPAPAPIGADDSLEVSTGESLKNSAVAGSINNEMQLSDSDEIDVQLDQQTVHEITKDLKIDITDLDYRRAKTENERSLFNACMIGTGGGLMGTARGFWAGLKWMFWEAPSTAVSNVGQTYKLFYGTEDQQFAAASILVQRGDQIEAIPAVVKTILASTLELPGLGIDFIKDESIPLSDKVQAVCQLQARIASEALLILFGPKGLDKIGQLSKTQLVSVTNKVAEIAKTNRMKAYAKSLKDAAKAFSHTAIAKNTQAMERARYELKLATMALEKSNAARRIAKISEALALTRIELTGSLTAKSKALAQGLTKPIVASIHAVEDKAAILKIFAQNLRVAYQATVKEASQLGLMVKETKGKIILVSSTASKELKIFGQRYEVILEKTRAAQQEVEKLADLMALRAQATKNAVLFKLEKATPTLVQIGSDGVIKAAQLSRLTGKTAQAIAASEKTPQIISEILAAAGKKLAMKSDDTIAFLSLKAEQRALERALQLNQTANNELRIAATGTEWEKGFATADSIKTLPGKERAVVLEMNEIKQKTEMIKAAAKGTAWESSALKLEESLLAAYTTRSNAEIAELTKRFDTLVEGLNQKMDGFKNITKQVSKKGYSLLPKVMAFILLETARSYNTVEGEIFRITPEELGLLPVGTVLADVKGQKVIVGLNTISTTPDENGLLKVGFLIEK